MKPHEFSFCTPTQYRHHLIMALKKLKALDSLNTIAPQIYGSIASQIANLEKEDNNNWAFETDPPWMILLNSLHSRGICDSDFGDALCELAIGSKIKVEKGKFTIYSISTSLALQGTIIGQKKVKEQWCLKNHRELKKLILTFHFDIDSSNVPCIPHYHLQIGGKSRTKLPEEYKNCPNWGIDKPRLFYHPMDIVLLLDMLLRQFGNSDSITKRIIEEPTWIDLVRKSENLFLHKYYSEMIGFIKSSDGQKYTLNSYIYGD